MENKNMVRWTNHERALLAHFVRIGMEENNLDLKASCEFASKKLGRSTSACMWQYNTFIRTGKVNPLGELKETQEEDSAEDLLNNQFQEEINFLKHRLQQAISEKNMMVNNVVQQLEDFKFNLNKIKELTSEITELDVSYHINLIIRILLKD